MQAAVEFYEVRRNHVPNPSFELATTGWVQVLSSTLTRTSAYANNGSYSLELTGINGSPRCVASTATGTSGMPVKQLVNYTLSFAARSSAVSAATAAIVYYTSSGLQMGDIEYVVLSNVTTGSFTRFSTSLVAPLSARYAAVFVGIDSPASGQKVYIDSVNFCNGDYTLFFSGDSADVGTSIQYDWTGTAHNSASTQKLAPGYYVNGAGSQYEFGGVAMGTESSPQIVVEQVEGLDSMPDIRSEDQDRSDTHGDFSGVDLLAARIVEMDIDLVTSTHSDAMEALRRLGLAMRPSRDTLLRKLVFQRPGEVERFVLAKPRRKEFPSNAELARGLGKGKLQWYCPDPRIYSLAEIATDITIADGQSTATGTVTNSGDFEMWPVLEILHTGTAVTNPRITHDGLTRAVRFDLTLNNNDVLRLDFQHKTATLNGVEAYQYKRGDNQWWDLLAGSNSITVSRTGTTGSTRFRFLHRDAWI